MHPSIHAYIHTYIHACIHTYIHTCESVCMKVRGYILRINVETPFNFNNAYLMHLLSYSFHLGRVTYSY